MRCVRWWDAALCALMGRCAVCDRSNCYALLSWLDAALLRPSMTLCGVALVEQSALLRLLNVMRCCAERYFSSLFGPSVMGEVLQSRSPKWGKCYAL